MSAYGKKSNGEEANVQEKLSPVFFLHEPDIAALYYIVTINKKNFLSKFSPLHTQLSHLQCTTLGNLET